MCCFTLKKYLNKFNLPSSNSLVARHDNEFMKYKYQVDPV